MNLETNPSNHSQANRPDNQSHAETFCSLIFYIQMNLIWSPIQMNSKILIEVNHKNYIEKESRNRLSWNQTSVHSYSPYHGFSTAKIDFWRTQRDRNRKPLHSNESDHVPISWSVNTSNLIDIGLVKPGTLLCFTL